MPAAMRSGETRTSRSARLGRLCAVVLMALLAVAVLHTVVPHAEAQRHCQACQVLHAPALAPTLAGLDLPLPPVVVLVAQRSERSAPGDPSGFTWRRGPPTHAVA
jgi:hypothetical protein